MPDSIKKLHHAFQRLIKHIQQYKLYLFTSLAYCFYLLTLPNMVALTIPCLRIIPFQAHAYADCNIIKVLDRLILFALAGYALTVLFLFIGNPRKSRLAIIITAILLALVTITLYYVYLTPLIRQIDRAQLYLDTIPQ